MSELEQEEEFSFKRYFVPLTTLKAIHWIVFIGLIVYANMLFNSFVWDDKSYIIQNPELSPFNPFALFGHNMFNAIGQYRPVPALYFAAIFAIFKNAQFFYHVPQLILHIINTVLVFRLFTKFFNKGISFFSSLFFLVHPLQVESVSFISATISPLFFFFGSSALLLSIKKIQTKLTIFLTFFLIFLSLLTKETGILFLFAIFVYKLLFNKKTLLSYLWLGLLTVSAYFLIRFFIGSVGFYRLLLIPISRLSLLERILNMPAILYYYISNVFFPNAISHNQLWLTQNTDFISFYFRLIMDLLFFLAIAITGFTLFKKKREAFKLYIFFLAWFVLGLGMHSQLIPLDETVSDRWFYFPIVGVIGMLAAFAQAYRAFLFNHIQIIIMLCIVIITAFSVRTIIRNTDWKDGITLYTHDMKISDNFDIEDNLGVEYFEQGNYHQAITHFKKSYEMFPYEVNAYNIALAYVQLGEYTNAEIYYDKSLQEKDYADTTHQHELGNYESYAQLLLHSKKYQKARKIVQGGIKDYPSTKDLWMFLAYAQYQIGDKKDALSAAQKAVTLEPSNSQAQALYDTISHNKQVLLKPIK